VKETCPRCLHGFPTVNKAINFISRPEKGDSSRIGISAVPVNNNSTCCLIRRTSTASANYGLLGRHGNFGPHGRVAFYLWLPACARTIRTHTRTRLHMIVSAEVARACRLFEGFHF